MDKAIQDFKDDGVCIVDGIFTSEEIKQIQDGFHSYLRDDFDIDMNNLRDKETIKKLKQMPKFGPHTAIFYPEWKMKASLDQRLFTVISSIWKETFATNQGDFTHPFGEFDPDKGYIYIDRIGLRLNDKYSEQGGLELHVDRNPWNPYDLELIKKWRPIQCFVSLTDQHGALNGGLKVVKGFHKQDGTYWNDKIKGKRDGEFIRLKKTYYPDLWRRLESINCSVGSIVCWDNRLPHATCAKFANDSPYREVLYSTFIPDIELNRNYVKNQLMNMLNGKAPPDFKTVKVEHDVCIDNYDADELMLLGVDLL